MRVAALCDIHGNLPALEAVLDEVERERVELVVVGGDTVTGPLAPEVLDRVLALGERVLVVRGNADREAVEVRRGAAEPGESPGPHDAWALGRLEERHLSALESLPLTVTVEVDGLGPVLFCHATPTSDTEIFLETTPDELVTRKLGGTAARTVVCGHTHMQFDRRVGEVRVVNAGSVGMPYEEAPGAYWALLGPDIELRRTAFDLDAAAEQIRATGWPAADEFVAENLLVVPSRAEALDVFEPLVDSG